MHIELTPDPSHKNVANIFVSKQDAAHILTQIAAQIADKEEDEVHIVITGKITEVED